MPLPGVYPRGAPAPTHSRAEQAFHRALGAKLPAGWFAWHSVRIRTRDNFEGEGDFVLAIPERGVIIIEVKGGAIEKRGGEWLQNGRPMEHSPRSQAHGYMNKLLRKLEERCAGGVPWLAIATAFPDTPFAQEPTQGDLAGAVLGQQDLAYLNDALPALVERLFAGKPAPRSSRFIEALHDLWCETWTPRLTLGTRVRMRGAELVPLDRDQVEMLDLVDHNTRLLVRGGPGTGKTLLAREMYRRLEAQSKRPVLVCSTNALAAGLRADGLLDAYTVGELAARLLQQAGVPIQEGAAPEEWTAETWQLASFQAAMDAVPAVERIYTAVVIDEAQDFRPNDWELVRAIADDGPLWAFGDDGQGFWEDRPLPDGLFPTSFQLRKRYRCPEPLAVIADQYRPCDARASAAPHGPIDELRIVRAPSERAIEERVANEIQKARGAGVAMSDIAVLSLGGQTRTRLCAGDKIGTINVARADDEAANDRVIADTFLRFKGLERPWIIVTELAFGTTKYDVRMHVALTRATVGCVIVATREEIEADPRLVALEG